MTTTEQRYAQIDKEVLVLTWACDRFSDYLISLNFNIHTNHNRWYHSSAQIDWKNFRFTFNASIFKCYMIPLSDFTHPWQRSCHCRHVIQSFRTRTKQFRSFLSQRDNVYVKRVVQSLPDSGGQLEKLKRNRSKM